MNICFHCRQEIELSEDAACGWRHTKSRRVICRETDATPMTGLQQTWWEYDQEAHARVNVFVRKTDK